MPRKKSEHLRAFATSKKRCKKHPQNKTPCVQCAALRYNRKHGYQPPSPIPSIYDDRHDQAVSEWRKWLSDHEENVNEGLR